MLILLYHAALTLVALGAFAILWQAAGPLILVPALWAIGYRLITGRDDPLAA